MFLIWVCLETNLFNFLSQTPNFDETRTKKAQDMTRPLPPLNALRAFEAAGRYESFSRAAEELGVAHSAISRHVRGLEHRLGVQLFRELSRGVALTREGQSYLARITPALDLISEATDDVGGTPEGRVILSSEPLFAQKVLLPKLSKLYAAYPDIDLRIEATTSLADMSRYEADLAVRFAHRGALDVPSELISNAKLYPYASPALRSSEWTDPRDLLEHRRYVERDGDTWARWARLMDVSHGFEAPAWRMDTRMSLDAALLGLGIYLGSAECVAEDVSAGRLMRCFDVGLADGSYHLVMREGGARRKAVRAVRSWLMEETAPFRSENS